MTEDARGAAKPIAMDCNLDVRVLVDELEALLEAPQAAGETLQQDLPTDMSY